MRISGYEAGVEKLRDAGRYVVDKLFGEFRTMRSDRLAKPVNGLAIPKIKIDDLLYDDQGREFTSSLVGGGNNIFPHGDFSHREPMYSDSEIGKAFFRSGRLA
jgi:hypothetical protein